MDVEEEAFLFANLDNVLTSIIADKRTNPKNLKILSKFKARINLGYQMANDEYFWVNLIAENGEFKLNRGKLEEYDLLMLMTPEDAMEFHRGLLSTKDMLTRKNEYGMRKLRFEKGNTGKRHLGLLLKFPKIFVLD
ncbi:MAG: hypothetical protein JW891_12645 [Candidatus Lokiarchaeota archaeon]|nr:hypothetical protein [Candidatus Lokiarchaeota archaeon]